MPYGSDFYDPHEMDYLLRNRGGSGVSRGGNRLGQLLMGGGQQGQQAMFQKGALEGATMQERMNQANLTRNKLVAQQSLKDSIIKANPNMDPAVADMMATQAVAGGGGNLSELSNFLGGYQKRGNIDAARKTYTDLRAKGASIPDAMAAANADLSFAEGKPEEITADTGGTLYSKKFGTPSQKTYTTAEGQSMIDLRNKQAQEAGARIGLIGQQQAEALARTGLIGKQAEALGTKPTKQVIELTPGAQKQFNIPNPNGRGMVTDTDALGDFNEWAADRAENDSRYNDRNWALGQYTRQQGFKGGYPKGALDPAQFGGKFDEQGNLVPDVNILPNVKNNPANTAAFNKFGAFMANTGQTPIALPDTAPDFGQDFTPPAVANARPTAAPAAGPPSASPTALAVQIPDYTGAGPATSATPLPKQKTIVRTGTKNGKKVVQYSDGSVEEA